MVMSRWAVVDATGMIAWAQGAPRDPHHSLAATAWSCWTSSDPAAACATARKDPRAPQHAILEALASNETTVIDVDTDPQAYPPITAFDDKLDAWRKRTHDAPPAK